MSTAVWVVKDINSYVRRGYCLWAPLSHINGWTCVVWQSAKSVSIRVQLQQINYVFEQISLLNIIYSWNFRFLPLLTIKSRQSLNMCIEHSVDALFLWMDCKLTQIWKTQFHYCPTLLALLVVGAVAVIHIVVTVHTMTVTSSKHLDHTVLHVVQEL